MTKLANELFFAQKGFYQQLTAAEMIGCSETKLVYWRKKGILVENFHWIYTDNIRRRMSYRPEACKLAIKAATLGR